jgi:hypothetical protein
VDSIHLLSREVDMAEKEADMGGLRVVLNGSMHEPIGASISSSLLENAK